ncbi:MAG: hypothetical protein HF981_00790 [Desulfobacteraceae bacterium]|nr:hypothetical protein [Desulfobacteraceae bacterium]MBC2748905.1 hypothetical protein [Desulfobacteraceae bacterium]
MLKIFDPKNGMYPYVIHGCPLTETEFPYSTHTHGLTEIGMPEFIFDPLAFGADGNTSRINKAFEFFMRPENERLMQSILRGQIVKLSSGELYPPAASEPYVYCFREVTPDFQAVIEAYGPEISKFVPPMRFIQIWVDGDDFALTDEYYRGSEKE